MKKYKKFLFENFQDLETNLNDIKKQNESEYLTNIKINSKYHNKGKPLDISKISIEILGELCHDYSKELPLTWDYISGFRTYKYFKSIGKLIKQMVNYVPLMSGPFEDNMKKKYQNILTKGKIINIYDLGKEENILKLLGIPYVFEYKEILNNYYCGKRNNTEYFGGWYIPKKISTPLISLSKQEAITLGTKKKNLQELEQVIKSLDQEMKIKGHSHSTYNYMDNPYILWYIIKHYRVI